MIRLHFLQHLLHGHNLRLRGRLGLAQVVTQTVAWVIFPGSSVLFDVMITLVVDFIHLKYRD